MNEPVISERILPLDAGQGFPPFELRLQLSPIILKLEIIHLLDSSQRKWLQTF